MTDEMEDVAEFLFEATQRMKHAALVVLEWSNAGCPEHLTPALVAAMKAAALEAECAKASGALWRVGDLDEDIDAIN